MTYPDKLYVEETGEVSADFRPATIEPDLILGSGTRVTYLATGASTRQGFGLYHWSMDPNRHGGEPHFHRTFSESFYVLSGEVGFFDGNVWHEAGQGDFFYVPPGGIHAFRKLHGDPASMLVLFAPGAPREAYFEGLNEIGALTDVQRAGFFIAHDNLHIE